MTNTADAGAYRKRAKAQDDMHRAGSYPERAAAQERMHAHGEDKPSQNRQHGDDD